MALEWLLNFFIVWIGVDIIIFASVWYLVTTIRPRYPNWWKRVVVDNETTFYNNTTKQFLQFNLNFSTLH